MSLSKDELQRLMAYVDGEVEEGEMPEVRALLANSEEARQMVAQHFAVGEWVRASAEGRATAERAHDIASAVMARIGESGSANVLELGRGRGTRTWSRERAMVFAVVSAAAIVVLVYAWPRDRAPLDPLVASGAPTPSNGSAVESMPGRNTPEPALPIQIAAAEPDGQGVDIQAVESPNHPVSIFYVPAAVGPNAHASSVVVWIGE
jgi:hypothetical protein